MALQLTLEANIPTILDHLESQVRAYFELPEMIEQKKRLQMIGDAVTGIFALIGASLQRVADF